VASIHRYGQSPSSGRFWKVPTRVSIGARADQLKGVGHIVVRVAPGGATYSVVVVDDSTEALTVKSTYGPYDSQ